MEGKGRIFPRGFEGQAPREFGINANILKTRTFALDAARRLEEVEIGGSCIWAITATSLTASIDIFINDQLRDPVTFQQGMFIRGIPFSRVFISHAAQAGETITIFFAVEEEVNNIQIVNPSVAFTNIIVSKSTTLNSGADINVNAAAGNTVMPANALRRVGFITSLNTNVNILRVGDINTAANRGMELAPGESIAFETTGDIRVYNPGPGVQVIARVWSED